MIPTPTDADRPAGEDGAEVNLFAPQTDASTIGDDHDFVVEGIVDIGQALIGLASGATQSACIASSSRCIETRASISLECLRGTLFHATAFKFRSLACGLCILVNSTSEEGCRSRCDVPGRAFRLESRPQRCRNSPALLMALKGPTDRSASIRCVWQFRGGNRVSL
jgi:hypothetical protein